MQTKIKGQMFFFKAAKATKMWIYMAIWFLFHFGGKKNIRATHTMSLVLKRSLWSNWDALGRIEGSVLVSRVIYLAKSGQFLDSMLGILPCRSSPSVCTRSISVPNGWNNSNAITPILYRSDCTNETNTEHMCLRCNSHTLKYSPKNSRLYFNL